MSQSRTEKAARSQPPAPSEAQLIGMLSGPLLWTTRAETRSNLSQPEASRVLRGSWDKLLGLAHSHHVIVRWLRALQMSTVENAEPAISEHAAGALSRERERIDKAMLFLSAICDELRSAGQNPVVIKSLDHWPDLGNDLDLLTCAEPRDVIHTMRRCFEARPIERSWGDRLANKWNFSIPGLRELVEVHVGRLGQTGEQNHLAQAIVSRSKVREVGGYTFRVPADEDRVLISTLQRMYRHFYLRLCDVVDTAALLEQGRLDFVALRRSGEAAAIWEGAATLLGLVSDYVRQYRGETLPLPGWVRAAVRSKGSRLEMSHGFLRIPILPDSVRLYVSELLAYFQQRNLPSSLRLTLLPGLAAAAAVEHRITGATKRVW